MKQKKLGFLLSLLVCSICTNVSAQSGDSSVCASAKAEYEKGIQNENTTLDRIGIFRQKQTDAQKKVDDGIFQIQSIEGSIDTSYDYRNCFLKNPKADPAIAKQILECKKNFKVSNKAYIDAQKAALKKFNDKLVTDTQALQKAELALANVSISFNLAVYAHRNTVLKAMDACGPDFYIIPF